NPFINGFLEGSRLVAHFLLSWRKTGGKNYRAARLRGAKCRSFVPGSTVFTRFEAHSERTKPLIDGLPHFEVRQNPQIAQAHELEINACLKGYKMVQCRHVSSPELKWTKPPETYSAKSPE